jgi:hypothetical protein
MDAVEEFHAGRVPVELRRVTARPADLDRGKCVFGFGCRNGAIIGGRRRMHVRAYPAAGVDYRMLLPVALQTERGSGGVPGSGGAGSEMILSIVTSLTLNAVETPQGSSDAGGPEYGRGRAVAVRIKIHISVYSGIGFLGLARRRYRGDHGHAGGMTPRAAVRAAVRHRARSGNTCAGSVICSGARYRVHPAAEHIKKGIIARGPYAARGLAGRLIHVPE